MWIDDPINTLGPPFHAKMTYPNAILNSEFLNFIYDDWRLPNIRELASIIDYGFSAPAIDAAIFPNTQHTVGTSYWSSTYLNANNAFAFRVYFSTGNQNYTAKTGSLWVRPVRLGLP